MKKRAWFALGLCLFAVMFQDMANGGVGYLSSLQFSASPQEPAFVVELDPAGTILSYENRVALTRGLSVEIPVRVQSVGGYEGTVSLSISNLPDGISASFTSVSDNVSPDSAFESGLVLEAADNVPISEFCLVVRGTGTDNLEETAKFWLRTRDFTVSLDRTNVEIEQAGVAGVRVSVRSLGWYPLTVDLSVTEPSGVHTIFDRMGPPPCDAYLTITVDPQMPIGDYALTVRAAGADGRTHLADFTLHVLRQAVRIPEIPAGDSRWLQIDRAGITQLELTAAAEIRSALVRVYKAAGPPENTPPPEGLVYSYIRIETENISPAAIDHVEVRFDVPRAWIENHGLDPARIRLLRLGLSSDLQPVWQDGFTVLDSRGVLSLHYRAEFSGLSLFVIVGTAVQKPSGPPAWTWSGLAGLVISVIIIVMLRRRHRG